MSYDKDSTFENDEGFENVSNVGNDSFLDSEFEGEIDFVNGDDNSPFSLKGLSPVSDGHERNISLILGSHDNKTRRNLFIYNDGENIS